MLGADVAPPDPDDALGRGAGTPPDSPDEAVPIDVPPEHAVRETAPSAIAAKKRLTRTTSERFSRSRPKRTPGRETPHPSGGGLITAVVAD